MGFVRIFWKNNVQEAYLPKMSISGQIVSEIVAQLCLENSTQTLLNFCGVDPKNPIISEISFLWRHTLVLYAQGYLQMYSTQTFVIIFSLPLHAPSQQPREVLLENLGDGVMWLCGFPHYLKRCS